MTSRGEGAEAGGRARSSRRLRRELVERLEREGALSDAAVRKAFLAVPRERFVPEAAARDGLEAVYRNQVILTTRDERGNYTSSSSQPSMMSLMLERLEVREGQRVLEVGAGTGYNGALLAELVGPGGRVVSVELEPVTARGARRALAGFAPVKVVGGDGRQGFGRGAPYDRIIVTASGAEVSSALFEQLVEGGLLELPLWVDRAGQTQAIVTFRKQAGRLRSVAVLFGGFMPLREAAGAAVPGGGVQLSAHERVGGHGRPLVMLGGEALRELSATARRRLLSLALSEPRVSQLGLRGPRGALLLYLALEAPQCFVGGWLAPGLIGAEGRGLALLAGRRTITRIEAFGDPGPERLLRDLVERWKRHGRPTERDLRVDVSFGRDGRSTITWGWSS